MTACKIWLDTPKFDPIKLMSSNKALFGVHMGLLEDPSIFKGHLDAISNMLERGEIDPIIDGVWRFEEVAEAQMHMHNRKNRGKILLDFSPSNARQELVTPSAATHDRSSSSWWASSGVDHGTVALLWGGVSGKILWWRQF